MQWIDLESAANHIHQARKDFGGEISPFFFLVGAGISHPPIPLASDIIEHCRVTAGKYDRIKPPPGQQPMDKYSHWFQQAYPQPIQRQRYLRGLIEKKAISAANFRLAHLMLEKTITNIVITTNFDDFLSQALTLFGKRHIVCDHPNTLARIDTEQNEIQIIHVHGSHWFYDCCNLQGEIEDRSQSSSQTTLTMAAFLDRILSQHSPLVIGYSGWKGDVIMTALERRLKNPLPYNIYWFCYRREDIDSLPNFLLNHQQVYFVAPPAQESITRQTIDEFNVEDKSAKKSMKKAMPKDITGFSGINDDKFALPAIKVFDKLITKFKLEAPEFTKDPLGFYVKYLRQSLLPDNPEKEESNIYFISTVIERIERAKQKDETINQKIEDVRDAIRRSQYGEAIRLATVIDTNELISTQLHELMDALWSATNELDDNSDEDLSGYDLIINLAETLLEQNINDLTLQKRIAQTQVRKSLKLGVLNRNEEAISADDDVVKRFGEFKETAIQEWVAIALVSKGMKLEVLNRNEEAISADDEVVKRFGESKETAVQKWVAIALVNKGKILGILNRNEEAISADDEVVKRFGESKETAVQEWVARAMYNKGLKLGVLNRNEEAISADDEVVKRFGESKETAVQKWVARAMFNKGLKLGVLNRNEEAISADDEVVKRFGEFTEIAIQELVAKALVCKGGWLGGLNLYKDAISVDDEVVKRFGESTETVIQESVAIALFSKGMRLGVLNRNDEAIFAYDEVVKRFGESKEAAIQECVAETLFSKGVMLGVLNKNEEAIFAYDEVVKRFGDSTETILQEWVAKALFNKGVRYGVLNRNEEAISAYDEVVKRFGDSTETILQECVAKANIMLEF